MARERGRETALTCLQIQIKADTTTKHVKELGKWKNLFCAQIGQSFRTHTSTFLLRDYNSKGFNSSKMCVCVCVCVCVCECVTEREGWRLCVHLCTSFASISACNGIACVLQCMRWFVFELVSMTMNVCHPDCEMQEFTNNDLCPLIAPFICTCFLLFQQPSP